MDTGVLVVFECSALIIKGKSLNSFSPVSLLGGKQDMNNLILVFSEAVASLRARILICGNFFFLSIYTNITVY